MIDQIATTIIISGSLLLFGYWFHYVCLLVLIAKPTRNYASIATVANRLRFQQVQARLRQPPAPDLDELSGILDRDHQILAYLLLHGGTPARGVARMEIRMLEIDYRLMRMWRRASSRISRAAACRAVDEMSRIVAHFANAMGERIVVLRRGIPDS